MSTVDILRDILVVLVAAKIAAELAERLNIPAVVGEIVAGVIIGPSLLGLVGTTEVLEVFAELGVILLLLQVGMEMDLGELAAVGRASVSVAVLGVVVPMVGGYAAGVALGQDSNTALFLGAALAATSVGITARVFSDLGALGSVEARTVLGAAVADDVLGLVILTIVVRIVTDGSVSLATVVWTITAAVGFLAITATLGGKLGVWLFRVIQRHSRSAGTLVALALAFALFFAELADVAKLAPIVGAFVAGLALSRTESRERISRELTPVGHLFIPVFFLQIGIAADVERFIDPTVLGIAGVLVVVAIVGKLASSLALFNAPGDKMLVGLGMLPRGEVGLIFATIGLTQGVLDDDLYAALLLVVLVTTLMAPPLLKARLRAMKRRSTQVGPTDVMPSAGWLWLDDDLVELAAAPPPDQTSTIAFDAALRVSEGARPGPRLLEFLGGTEPVPWDEHATRRLVDVLERGNERGWRFLDTSGVLLRLLPEVAAAVARRHRDPGFVDPSLVVRFPTIEALRDLAAADPVAIEVLDRLEDPEVLTMAAFLLDLAGERPPADLLRAVADRLQLDAGRREELLVLCSEQGLLRGVSGRLDAASEDSALAVASHLALPEYTRALYLLDLALGPIESVGRDRLDRLLEGVIAAQEGIGRDSEPGAFAYRRDEALRLAAGDREPVVDRIRHASRPYLLAQSPERIVAQARLLSPRPHRREVRVALGPVPRGGWYVDIAARDQAGLLAAVAEVFADRELDISTANIATWGDGAALESFTVEARPGLSMPSGEELASAIETRLGTRTVATPLPDADVAFDDAGSPWYTLCEVRHVDRPGLVADVAAALSVAGASVHAADLVTVDGVAVDSFALTDSGGGKLTRDQKDAIRTVLQGGGRSRGRLGWLVGR